MPPITLGNRLLPYVDEPRAMQWEFKETQLNLDQVHAPEFELRVPVLNETVVLKTKMRVCKNGDYLDLYLIFPKNTMARVVQWVGPRNIKTRYFTDEWKGGAIGKLNYWRIADHVEDGILRVGVAVLLTEPSELPERCPRFRLLKTLDEGSYGVVREVEDQEDETARLVAKIDAAEEKEEMIWWDILSEAQVLSQLSDEIGFPKFEGLFLSGEATGETSMIVMQRLHRNLESLMTETYVGSEGHLSAATVIGVGLRCIERLETMHDLGLLHRDIKPENIMIDKEGENEIYLIDFGMSRPFSVAGVSFQLPKSACGTVRFYAVRTHDGFHTRITDLETLCHVLCYVAVGSLPWSGIRHSKRHANRKIRDDQINDVKKDLNRLSESLKACPHAPLADALLEMVSYCRTCSLDERPDYDRLRDYLFDAESSIIEPLGRIASDQSTVTNYDWIAGDHSSKAFKIHDTTIDFISKGTDRASKGSRFSWATRWNVSQFEAESVMVGREKPMWQVVGGSDTGGILVREGEDTKSKEVGRLSSGAVVKGLTLKGVRLNYSLISGTGPAQGWVTLRIAGKDLLIPWVEAGPNGAFDGTWVHEGDVVALISGANLHWTPDGDTNSIVITSRTSFSITVEGEMHTVDLAEDGKLYWSDGEIWERQEQAVWSNPIEYAEGTFWDRLRDVLGRSEEEKDLVKTCSGQVISMSGFSCFADEDLVKLFPISVKTEALG